MSRGRRGNSSTANGTLHTLSAVVSPSSPSIPYTPQILADDRYYFPDRASRPLAAVTRRAQKVVVADSFGKHIRAQTKAPLAFAEPAAVVLCRKRQKRKEVFHALKLAGGKGYKKPRRKSTSKISCR